MSVVDAAGFAMAPGEDIYSVKVVPQPEVALRNGHQAAARNSPAPAKEPSTIALHAEAWTHWLRVLFGFGGNAAA